MRALIIGIMIAAAIAAHEAKGQIDNNGNQQSDVWEMRYGAQGLAPDADADGDGATNRDEAEAGTDPLDATSNFKIASQGAGGPMIEFDWAGSNGKVYHLQHSPDLASAWSIVATYAGQDAAQAALVDFSVNPGFYRLEVVDTDTDNDGVADWEELALGFDPTNANTDRYAQSDLTRVQAALGASNTVTATLLQSEISEDWGAPAILLIQRSGGLDAIEVNLAFSGSATEGVDYAHQGASVSLGVGQIAAWLPITPVNDQANESNESITITLQSGSGYSIGSPSSVTLTILDDDVSDAITPREAARFLGQATFGPTETLIGEVQAQGFDAWLEAQFQQPIGWHQPVFQSYPWDVWEGPYAHHKMLSWWEMAMNAPDPLRQRVGFALSEILVISDTNGVLEGHPVGMLNYYDMLLEHSFGNYRDLLEAVTYHPCMGTYLSHRSNRPANPERNFFPDENYAREIMQLFSIGLWMLNEDGTLMLDQDGDPIPTYDNDDITNLASVFTGMTWGVSDSSVWWQFYWPETELEYWEYFLEPMQIFEGQYNTWNDELQISELVYYHDQGPKTVLGVNLPANDPLNPEPNYGTNDVDRALDVIFNHPNVGPFIGKKLIQRLVTSNPSNAYVARVTEAFNGGGPHNPNGIRGDMKSVLRAILLDPEARDAAMINDPEHGMLRENYLRLVALARAFNASAPSGNYEIFWVNRGYGMQPMNSPSVFNFFQSEYQPLGDIRNAGLVAPEFQILTAVTGISIPNHLRQAVEWQVNWPDDDNDIVSLDLSPAMALADDTDALLEYLDVMITFGNMSPELHQIIRDMLSRPEFDGESDAFKVQSAMYLIATSADAAVIR